MTCDSGGGLITAERRLQEDLDLTEMEQHRRPLHLDARTVPSHGATVRLGPLPRHGPPQLAGVVLLRREGSGEETRGAETVMSLKKDALGWPCNCNGSCASQQVPTRLLRLSSDLHGPVECAGLLLHLDTGHKIAASVPDVMGELPRELHYDGRPLLALQTAPVSKRILSKWPKDISQEDLSYLHEIPMRLLHLTSGPHVTVECARLLLHLERGCHGITASLLDATGELTKELHYVAGDCTLGDGRPLLALQTPVSTRVHIKCLMEISVDDHVCYLHFGDLNMTDTTGEGVNEIYAIESTNIGWRSLSGLLKIAKGSGEETRGAETVMSLPCNCNGSCELQQVPTRLLCLGSRLHGPVECAGLLLHLDTGHKIAASVPDVMGELPRELLALQAAPVSKRVLSKWPKDISVEDLSYLHEIPMRLLKYQETNKESGHWLLNNESDAFSTSYLCYIGPDASAGVVSCNFPTHMAEIKRQCVVKQGSLLDAWDQLSQEPCYMIADLTSGDVRLLFSLEIAPVMGTRVPIKWSMDTPSTQEQRTMWLLLNNNTPIFRGNTRGIMHMDTFQDMCLNLNSTNTKPCDRSSFQKNQAMNKESGVWLVKDELDYFNGSHRPDASAGVVSCSFATQLPKIKCQCALKHGSEFVPRAREVDAVASAKDHMAGMTEHVMDTVPEEFLPAQLHKTDSHCILDGKLSKQRTLCKWFFITRRWFLGSSVVESRQLRDRYPLTSSPKGDAPATFIMELAHEVHEYYKSSGSIQFLLGISMTYVIPGRNGQATRMVHVPLLSQPNSELAESELDSQPPIFPLTTNIIVDSHDAERQHIDPCSKSNVQSHQLTPIFVRHVSGELVFSVNLEQSSDHLMQLYAHKTKTKLECQYFVYGRKILQPHGSLMFYGVERDTTIHVCTRLLGGLMTIGQFITKHKHELLTEVTLPNGLVSLKMTKAGCLFLSTWLKCFTRAFADSKTWNGDFTLDDFRVLSGHVLVINSAEKRLDSSSMHADLKKLVTHINRIFYRNESHLISKFAPYLENLTNFLLKLKYPVLVDADRLFIETHICCVESAARGMLLVMLRRKQKSLDELQQDKWERATVLPDDQQIAYASFTNLFNTPVFNDAIANAMGRNEPYGNSRHSTFRLMRDEFMHGPSNRFDKTCEPWTEKFKNDDGIELMIPAYNPHLVPNIIYSWINDKSIDIKPELLAVQVRCTCVICHPAHSGHTGGEGSSKGKQPESSESSQPSTPSSRGGIQRRRRCESSSFCMGAAPIRHKFALSTDFNDEFKAGEPRVWETSISAAAPTSRKLEGSTATNVKFKAGRPRVWDTSISAAVSTSFKFNVCTAINDRFKAGRPGVWETSISAAATSPKFQVSTAINDKLKAGIQPRRWEWETSSSISSVPSSSTSRASSCSYTAAVLIIGFGTRLAGTNKEREGQER